MTAIMSTDPPAGAAADLDTLNDAARDGTWTPQPPSARRPPGRPARAHAPRRERPARPPRITPAIIREGQYELVKAPDYAESRAWHVLVGRRRAGLVRPSWQGGETGRAWEAVDLSSKVLQVTGTGGVTRARNARNRDAAAINLLSALLRQQVQW